MKNAEHINPELLLAHSEGTGAQRLAVVSHLRGCSSCAEQYVQFIFKRTRRTVSAPSEMWPGIQSTLEEDGVVSAKRFSVLSHARFATATVLFVIAVLFAGYFVLQLRSSSASLDLGRYIAVLEKSSAAPNEESVHKTFVQLAPYDREEALRRTGVRPQIGQYRLIDQSVFASKQGDVFELAYRSAEDSFVLFVAPRAARLSFGKYHLVAAELQGVQCQRVQCPRQDIFWTVLNGRQYLFFRQRRPLQPSGNIFSEFIKSELPPNNPHR